MTRHHDTTAMSREVAGDRGTPDAATTPTASAAPALPRRAFPMEDSIVEYQRSRSVAARPDDVFAFVTDPGNLPVYVPAVDAVEPVAEGRVRVRGRAGATAFDELAWFHVDHNQRGVAWRVEERETSGWVTVTAADDGATQIVAHLSWPPHVSQDGAPLSGEPAVEPDPAENALEAGLDSLRNVIEGRGGKEPADALT